MTSNSNYVLSCHELSLIKIQPFLAMALPPKKTFLTFVQSFLQFPVCILQHLKALFLKFNGICCRSRKGSHAKLFFFFFSSLFNERERKKYRLGSVLTWCLLIVEYFCIQDLTFQLMVGKARALVLYSESAFPVLWSGRKRWLESRVGVCRAAYMFRCAPLPVFHVAAHANLGIAFRFCVLCYNNLFSPTWGIFHLGVWVFGLYI